MHILFSFRLGYALSAIEGEAKNPAWPFRFAQGDKIILEANGKPC